jgi:uncharacterized protein YeaO (DUF488 family)
MKNKLLLTLLLSILVTTSTVLAQEELPPAGITPDSWLYGLEKIWEKIQLFFTFDSEGKAKLHLQFASERLAEANEMIRKGKPEFVQDLMKEHEKEINETEKEIENLKTLGRNITTLIEHVSNVTYKHILILEEVLEKVPEQAKPAIAKAINVSLKGHETAIARLSENLPERAAELRMRFAESRLEKAKTKALEEKIKETEEFVKDYEKEINETTNLVEKAEGLGKNVTALAEYVCNMTYKHILVLEKVLINVSEQAKPAIEHAINVSLKGHENCVEKIKERIEQIISKTRTISCEKNVDCAHLICPMVVGYDTPICEEGKCKCGAKWEIVNATEWKERFNETLTQEVQKGIEEIEQMYNQTRIKEIVTKK